MITGLMNPAPLQTRIWSFEFKHESNDPENIFYHEQTILIYINCNMFISTTTNSKLVGIS